MLVVLEETYREQKEQRFEASREGEAYRAAHPGSLPKGLAKRMEGRQAVSRREREAANSTEHYHAALQGDHGDETSETEESGTSEEEVWGYRR